MRHGTKSCNELYKLEETDDGVPYLECEGCGYKIEDWIKWHASYVNYCNEDSRWKSKKDHLTCLLSYFAKLYKEYYEIDFTFSLNDKGLFRSAEAHLIRKMYTLLGSDADASRDYIDWIFETKVTKRKKKITSIGFLATPAIIQEFKLAKVKKTKISRSTPLPPKMIKWAEKFAPQVLENYSLRDFGELQLLLTYCSQDYESFEGVVGLGTFLEKLKDMNYINSNLIINNWSE